MIISLILFFIVLALLIGEAIIINKSARALRLKVHVNGTRGKSSVTKYIAAGFREANLKTYGKVTGEIPSLILNDGKIEEIKRKGPARVQEQFNIIRKAKKNHIDALVLECMSIDPALQRVESNFYKPHIYVITNIRDDHREKMGDTIEEQIFSICNAIPKKSVVITLKSNYSHIIEKIALLRNSTFIEAIELEQKEINLIPSSAYESNVRLALTVCQESGIPRKIAFAGILKQLDITISPVYSFSLKNQQSYFLNAFSVNDIETTNEYLSHWKHTLEIQDSISIVFNTRADRPLRTDLFAEWIKANANSISSVALIGDHKARASRILKHTNIKVHKIANSQNKNIKQAILDKEIKSKLIVGIGNIKGLGYQIINEFDKAS